MISGFRHLGGGVQQHEMVPFGAHVNKCGESVHLVNCGPHGAQTFPVLLFFSPSSCEWVSGPAGECLLILLQAKISHLDIVQRVINTIDLCLNDWRPGEGDEVNCHDLSPGDGNWLTQITAVSHVKTAPAPWHLRLLDTGGTAAITPLLWYWAVFFFFSLQNTLLFVEIYQLLCRDETKKMLRFFCFALFCFYPPPPDNYNWHSDI